MFVLNIIIQCLFHDTDLELCLFSNGEPGRKLYLPEIPLHHP